MSEYSDCEKCGQWFIPDFKTSIFFCKKCRSERTIDREKLNEALERLLGEKSNDKK